MFQTLSLCMCCSSHMSLHIMLFANLILDILRCETVTWSPRSSPACDLCQAEDDVQDEQHVIFHSTHPHVLSLRRRFASLFSSETRVQDVFAFLHQNNNKLHFFLTHLLLFMSRLAVERIDWRPFSCKPCNPFNLPHSSCTDQQHYTGCKSSWCSRA